MVRAYVGFTLGSGADKQSAFTLSLQQKQKGKGWLCSQSPPQGERDQGVGDG